MFSGNGESISALTGLLADGSILEAKNLYKESGRIKQDEIEKVLHALLFPATWRLSPDKLLPCYHSWKLLFSKKRLLLVAQQIRSSD